ncbi:MAG: redoxin domain-containing protein [Bryobacteraceae bacterium]
MSSNVTHIFAARAMCSIALLGVALLSSQTGWAQDDNLPAAADVPPILRVGSPAPDFNLRGIDDKMHSLKDYAPAKVLVIVFTCDHCPIAGMYEHRTKDLTSDYKDRDVDVVAIMGNDPKAIHLSELGHTDLSDTFPEMKLRAAYRHFNFPYLYDGDTQAVALKYGPTATPHAFIFDQQRILRYQGRIDNNPREELVTKHEARDAIDALLAGKPVLVANTPAMGCSTKWAYKEVGAKAETAEGNEKPVTVDMVTADQLTALRQNRGAGKLLLINFWATWCAPCTTEFPELQKMVRQYAKRALDIVTVSINAPDEKKFVLDFLKEQHAINRNLLWSTNDSAEAVKAFGPEWSGGVPFTVLIGMNGEILFKTQGGMNPLEVKHAILKNLPDDRYVGQHAYWNSTF